jgi:hypothetical protein
MQHLYIVHTRLESRMISICFILFLLISILTSSYGQVTCATGWVQYGGSCYLFNPTFNGVLDNGTWDQCNAYCPASYPGATMFCVNNAAENEWIRGQFTNLYYWIGYTDMLPYGGGKGTKQYGWVTGCSSSYTNWYWQSAQPDNHGNNQDYAAVYHYDGSWHDYGPQGQSIFCGCEYTPALTTTPSSRPTTIPSSTPSTVPSFRPTASPSSHPSTVPSFRPTVAPSSGSTSSPTATPSFSSSQGDISE